MTTKKKRQINSGRVHVSFRPTLAELEKYQAEAKREHRSVSQWIRIQLAKVIKHEI